MNWRRTACRTPLPWSIPSGRAALIISHFWPAWGWPFGWRSACCARRARRACTQEASLIDLAATGAAADTDWREPRPGPGKAQSRPAAGPSQHLIQVAGLRIGALDAMRVAFALATRLNAADRLENACAAYDLLMCEDSAQAAALAAQLDRQNRERQQVMAAIAADAEQRAIPR